nr:hypothetical protein [Thermodesulfobacterium thermophilum]
MAEFDLERILEEFSKIDSKEGLRTLAALLLNELMKKEREIFLRNSIDNKANGYFLIRRHLSRELCLLIKSLYKHLPQFV